MGGPLIGLIAFPQFFAKFFSRPYAGKLDLYITAWLQTGQSDEVFRQVHTRICLPMSSTNASPPSPIDAACKTRWTASGMVMK